MKTYTVFQVETGEILRKVSCPKNQAVLQCNTDEDEWVIEGDWDDTKYKIIDDVPVLCTQEEKNLREFTLKKTMYPRGIHKDMTNEELDLVIDEYFLGLMDIQQWKLDNYSYLREQFYPSIYDLVDADLKLRSKENKEKEAGQIQKDLYDAQCWEVKRRFPNE